jgi:glycogen debranching enzyme
MKTTIEKNRMLLDFMGEKPVYNSFTGKYGWSDSPWFACSYDTEEEVMDAVAKYAKYNSDWNWLMKCIEKILSICSDIDRVYEYDTIIEQMPEIEHTFNAVIGWVEYYNKYYSELPLT